MGLRKIHLDDLTKEINDKKATVEQEVLRTLPNGRRVRTRERDPEEQRILDQLCIQRWKQAERDGKIKYLSDRKWYYDYD